METSSPRNLKIMPRNLNEIVRSWIRLEFRKNRSIGIIVVVVFSGVYKLKTLLKHGNNDKAPHSAWYSANKCIHCLSLLLRVRRASRAVLSQVSFVPVTVSFALLLRVTVANRQCWRGLVLSLSLWAVALRSSRYMSEQAIDVVTFWFCPRHCQSLLFRVRRASRQCCHR